MERFIADLRQKEKDEQNRLKSFREIPKVELHRHLEGSIRLSTLVELAPQIGIAVTAQPQEQFLVLRPMQDLATVLNKFWLSQSILSSPEILSRITFEAVEDAQLDGITQLELRYSPTFIQKGHEALSFAQIHQSLLTGLQLAKLKYPQIQVGLICIIQRTLPLPIAEKVCRFAIENQDSIVGLDLADDEDAVPAKIFAPVFALAQKANLPITVHAGESNSASAAQNVIDAIQVLGARRIGHGLQIINNPLALELVIKTKTPLELCISSNWLTHAINEIHLHPIRKLMAAGVAVTINSDDPGIFGISLSHEYELLSRIFNFSHQDFANCNHLAGKVSFLKPNH